MNALQRRLWVGAVGLLASLIVIAGLAVGAFRIAVQLVPEYRAEVEQRVGELIGSPVRIEQMDLIWRGRYPTLLLQDLAVGAQASSRMDLQELSLGFAITRLLRGDLYPAQVGLRGTRLQLIREQGQFRLAGINPRGEQAGRSLPQVLDQLRRIGRIRWQQAELRFDDRDQGLPPLDIVIEELRSERLANGLAMNLRLHQAQRPAQALRLELALTAQPWQPRVLRIEGERLLPWAQLSSYWPDFPALDGEIREFRLDADWRDGRWQQAQLELQLEDMAPLGEAVAVQQLSLQAQLDRPGPEGWRASVQLEEFASGQSSWPAQNLLLNWQSAVAAQSPRYSLSMEYLRLQDLQAWFALLPEDLAATLKVLSPRGELRDLVVQSSAGQGWPRVSAELKNLAFSPYREIPGIENLSAALSVAESELRLQIDSEQLRLDAPAVFAQPLQLNQLSGALRWLQTAEGWRLDAPGLHYAGLNLDGVGRLQLIQGQDLQIDLDLNFFCSDPRPWLAYQPLIWHPRLRDWLSAAIGEAEVASGQVRIQGGMADFPFHQRQGGEFVVDLALQNAALKFAPDWPQVDVASARLLIDGHALSVAAEDAQIGGVQARSASARIADLRDSVLEIEADTQGNAKDVWRMLSQSGLRRQLAELFDSIDISGKVAGDLKLVLPLNALENTRYSVDAELDRAALWTRYWPDPVQKISGQLQIDNKGLRGRGLTAAVAGVPMTVQLTPRDGLTRIEAAFSASAAQLPASVPVPGFIKQRASGEADWRLNLEVGNGADTTVKLHSSMLGMALDLPPPFGKQADQLRTLDLRIEPARNTRVHLNYSDQLGLDLLLAPAGGLQAARLRLGGDVLPAGAPGWWIEGQLARADFEQWLPLIQDLAAELADSPPAAGQTQGFGGLVVKLDQLNALGQRLPDTRLQLTRDDGGWRLGLSGPRASGILRFPPLAANERLRINAEFEQMNWTRAVRLGGEADVLDPRELPILDLSVKSFFLNDVALGQLKLELQAVRDGVRIAQATVDAGERRELDLSGLWLRDQRGSSAALELDMDTENFSSWLSVLGFQDNIRARRGTLNARLNWAPHADGLQVSALAGALSFDFRDGQLLNIEPGAGRVLGLFSVNALPRRFFLDFSDVVSSGLGFDELSGKFELADGIASTQNLELEGPSLRIAARGSVDLVRREYDQIITVYPGISSGVSLAATVLGGPVIGLFAVLAQELLDQPLDQVTQFGYHLGGDWDNPQVSRLQ